MELASVEDLTEQDTLDVLAPVSSRPPLRAKVGVKIAQRSCRVCVCVCVCDHS